MAWHVTSHSDFDKGGCVTQVEWTLNYSVYMNVTLVFMTSKIV